MYKAGDVRVKTVPDARIVEPTDALLRVTHACICGSDLWPYNLMEPDARGRPMGHEAIGIVEALGAEVSRLKKGDLVVSRSPTRTAPAASAARGSTPRA